MGGDDGEKTISLEMAKWKNECQVLRILETCAFSFGEGSDSLGFG